MGMDGAEYIVARPGGGALPDVIAHGTVDEVQTWGQEASKVTIRRVFTVPSGGDVAALREAVMGVSPLVGNMERMQRQQMGQYVGRRKVTMPRPLDLAADVTMDPSLSEVLPWSGTVVVRTGRGVSGTGIAQDIGRLDLLAHLKSRMARKQVAVEIEDEKERKAFRRALEETATKPPATEADGLALVDTTERESTALAVALLVWRAYKEGAVGEWGERDTSRLVVY